MPEMFDISDAYGRQTSAALRRSRRGRAKDEADIMNQLAAGGASADQLLRAKGETYRAGLESEGDILAGMGTAQAGALFNATEARNQMEYQGGLEKELQEASFGQERGMWELEDAANRRREEEAKKEARAQRWMSLIGMLGQPIVSGLVGKFLG